MTKARVAIKTRPSKPTTSKTTHQVLSGNCAVLSTAPIQATKCASAAKSKINIASTSRPSNVHDSTPDSIPVTSGPLMTKMSLLIARTPVTPTSTNPATSPMRLPQNNLTINDLVTSTTSKFQPARYLSETEGTRVANHATQRPPALIVASPAAIARVRLTSEPSKRLDALVLALRRVFANQSFQ